MSKYERDLGTKSVSVCWENPSVATSEQREAVRAAVARTWSFAGDFQFTGWGTCPTSSTGIRIRLQDDRSGPRVTAFGRKAAGVSPGIILNNTFDVFRIVPGQLADYNLVARCDKNTSAAADIVTCMENIAIHEFGHLLGFHHEQNHPSTPNQHDFPSNCPALVDSRGSTAGNTLYNDDWDLHSVMNYCNPSYAGSHLSGLDVAGMQSFYDISPRFIAALAGGGLI